MSVKFPDNPLTRMMEQISDQNRATGGRRGMPISADPSPSVRSASVGQEVVPEEPLTPDRIEELNALARAAGIRDERIGTAEEQQGAYASLEEALVAGRGTTSVVLTPPRATPRPAALPRTSRLPDFNNVQGIDLIDGVVILDNLEFKLPAKKVRELRKYAIDIARRDIMMKLDKAWATNPTRRQPLRRKPNGGDIAGSTSQDASVQSESQGSSEKPTE